MSMPLPHPFTGKREWGWGPAHPGKRCVRCDVVWEAHAPYTPHRDALMSALYTELSRQWGADQLERDPSDGPVALVLTPKKGMFLDLRALAEVVLAVEQ